MTTKVYLGDSVYAEFDVQIRGDVQLTTENGYGPSNTIYLEDFTLAALDRVREARRIQNEERIS